MKFRMFFKTPDCVDYAIKEAQEGVTDNEKLSEIKEEILATTNKFVEYSECVHIEFDTETKEARVLPV